MTQYEYKVIAAPTKGKKAPGIKTAEGRFAHAIEGLINDLAAEGWFYLRADLLPSEERQGLTASQTVYRSLLVFRREIATPQIDITQTGNRHAELPRDVSQPETATLVARPLEDVPELPSNQP